MAEVIIYQNPNGTNVCVCSPTGEISIQEVLVKDCPAGAIIVDSSTLPQGSDAQFFDAWVLNESTVTVDIAKAKFDMLARFNAAALAAGQIRQNNTYAGIANDIPDVTWQANLAAGRTAIAAAKTTAELIAIALPTA
jgi:hypothetical protein